MLNPTRFHSRRPSPAKGPLLITAACALSLVACSGGDDDSGDDEFVVENTRHAAASASTPLLGDGNWLAYLLSEAGQDGTDLNGDTDTMDSIVTRVNTNSGAREVIGVAAERLAFARRTLFMIVEEADDATMWSPDMDMNDRVLLYLTPTSTVPEFVAELAPGSDIFALGGTIVYEAAGGPGGAMETNLNLTTVATNGAVPSLPVPILMNAMDADPGADGVSYSIIGSDGDLLFALADEAVEGAALNGDATNDGDLIFAVCDVGATTPEVVSTELAFATNSTPTAVPVSGGGEWLVAFLVSEAGEGDDLNDPNNFSMAWEPPGCSGPDGDQTDSVLHWFQITDLAMNTAAVNTGLVGASDGIAYALGSEFVGVVSPEADAGCDLNGDGDDATGDEVFRWVDASNAAMSPLPITTQSRLFAVNTSIPGGSGGVVRLDDLWVLNVDEAANEDGNSNYDGDVTTDREVIAAHDPSTSDDWNFLHGTGSPRPVGATWMQEDPESSSRFFAAFSEDVHGLNSTFDLTGDGDYNDAVPTIASVISGDRLTFPGVQTATSRTNSGLVVEENVAFHRVPEADIGATGLDLNGDGDRTDVVIQRFSLLNEFPRTLMATSASGARPAVTFGEGNARFGAFLTEEGQADDDLNNDGDENDFVVRYFRLP